MAKHTKYTEEDVNWAKSLIESHFAKGDKITKSKVVAKGLILNYTERFKIGVTVDALTCWLKRVHNPEEFKKYEKAYAERKKLKINPATVFE